MLVLGINLSLTQLTDLLLLDALNLVAVVLKLLAKFATLLHVVELILVSDFGILLHLLLDLLTVSDESLFLILLLLALSLLVGLLLFDNAQEIVTLGLGCDGDLLFLVFELLDACNLQVFLNLVDFHLLSCCASTGELIGLFSCTLGFCFVNLSLTVVSFFLKGKQSLKFLFLFSGNSNGLSLLLLFNFVLGTLVFNDLLLKCLLFISADGLELN